MSGFKSKVDGGWYSRLQNLSSPARRRANDRIAPKAVVPQSCSVSLPLRFLFSGTDCNSPPDRIPQNEKSAGLHRTLFDTETLSLTWQTGTHLLREC